MIIERLSPNLGALSFFKIILEERIVNMDIVEKVEQTLGTVIGSWHKEFITKLYEGLKAGEHIYLSVPRGVSKFDMQILYSLVVLIVAEENGYIHLNRKSETLCDSCELQNKNCGCDCTREYKPKESVKTSSNSNVIILQCEARMKSEQLEVLRLDLLEQAKSGVMLLPGFVKYITGPVGNIDDIKWRNQDEYK